MGTKHERRCYRSFSGPLDRKRRVKKLAKTKTKVSLKTKNKKQNKQTKKNPKKQQQLAKRKNGSKIKSLLQEFPPWRSG